MRSEYFSSNNVRIDINIYMLSDPGAWCNTWWVVCEGVRRFLVASLRDEGFRKPNEDERGSRGRQG